MTRLFTAALAAALLLGGTLGGCSCGEEEQPPSPVGGTVSGTITFGTPAGAGLLPAAPAGPALALRPAFSDAVQALVRPTLHTTRGGPPFKPGEVIVRVKQPFLAPGAVLAQVSVDGVALRYVVNVMPRWHLLRAERDGQPLSLAETLTLVATVKALPTVEDAELNRIEHALAVPSDGLYKYQWHYPQMQLPAAWDVTTGSEAVVVAVVDTGILNHPDLSPRVVKGIDFISDAAEAGDGDGRDDDPTDMGKDEPNGGSSWHGTHVAGTIGALSDNAAGVSGVDWKCRIMPVRVLGKSGGTVADIASAMAWAVGVPVSGVRANASPARVVNLSLGGDGTPSSVYQDAIDQGNARGAVFVVAAGNEAENTQTKRPANQKDVIAVGALSFSGKKATYSNYGAEVDVMAPGGEMTEDADSDGQPDGVLSTHADAAGKSQYDFMEGTSMATPHVAGLAALMKGLNNNLGVAQLEQILKDTAITAYRCDQGCGAGLVNAQAAVLKAKGVLPTGPAELSVSTREVSLSGGGRAAIGVSNRGGGSLTVKATLSGAEAARVKFVGGDSRTLGAAQADVLVLEADTSGLANGTYPLQVDLKAGAAGTATVRVGLVVGSAGGGRKTVVATIYKNQAGEWKAARAVELDSAPTRDYAIKDVPPGDYFVVAGADDNGNGEYFEDGERFGIYKNTETPVPVTVGEAANIGHVDFSIVATGSAPADEATLPVGAACQSGADCGRGDCDTSWPGGYCYAACDADADCGASGACQGSTDRYCYAKCANPGGGQSSCRQGYVCALVQTGGVGVCVAPCTQDSDCTTTCDRSTGYCR